MNLGVHNSRQDGMEDGGIVGGINLGVYTFIIVGRMGCRYSWRQESGGFHDGIKLGV